MNLEQFRRKVAERTFLRPEASRASSSSVAIVSETEKLTYQKHFPYKIIRSFGKNW